MVGQTFAFLDSLSKMVSGVGTVWIIVKSEIQLIDDGYQLAKRCFNQRSNMDVTTSKTSSTRTSFRVEYIPDDEPLRDVRGTVIQSNVAQTLGKTLIDILRMRSRADHVMLAVDEMIWLRPVNLWRAAQQLKHCNSGKVRFGAAIYNVDLCDSILAQVTHFSCVYFYAISVLRLATHSNNIIYEGLKQ